MGPIFHNLYAIAHGEAVRHFQQYFETEFPWPSSRRRRAAMRSIPSKKVC
jgi:hypothetical protein